MSLALILLCSIDLARDIAYGSNAEATAEELDALARREKRAQRRRQEASNGDGRPPLHSPRISSLHAPQPTTALSSSAGADYFGSSPQSSFPSSPSMSSSGFLESSSPPSRDPRARQTSSSSLHALLHPVEPRSRAVSSASIGDGSKPTGRQRGSSVSSARSGISIMSVSSTRMVPRTHLSTENIGGHFTRSASSTLADPLPILTDADFPALAVTTPPAREDTDTPLARAVPPAAMKDAAAAPTGIPAPVATANGASDRPATVRKSRSFFGLRTSSPKKDKKKLEEEKTVKERLERALNKKA